MGEIGQISIYVVQLCIKYEYIKKRLVGNKANEMVGWLGDENFALFLKI